MMSLAKVSLGWAPSSSLPALNSSFHTLNGEPAIRGGLEGATPWAGGTVGAFLGVPARDEARETSEASGGGAWPHIPHPPNWVFLGGSQPREDPAQILDQAQQFLWQPLLSLKGFNSG